MTLLETLVLALLIFSAAVQTWLHSREIRFLRAGQDQPDLDEKTASYRIAGLKVSAASILIQTVFVIVLVFGGGLPWLQTIWTGGAGPIVDIAFLVCVVLALAAVRRSIVAFRVWGVERRFDFSNQTAFLFIKDTLFQGILLFALTLVIGGGALFALERWGLMGWAAIWLMWTAFGLLRTWLYPLVIAPLFNDFSSPENVGLVDKVKQLGNRAGTKVGKVLIMDGSRRSSHGNAHVAGLGTTKRVVLLDTLFNILTLEEILGVLAHELGHQKHSHIAKYRSLEALASAIWIGVFGYASGFLVFQHFGPGQALALMWMLTPLLIFWVQPFFSALIQSFEYQADTAAVQLGYGEALGSALIKLNSHNAATPRSEPLFAWAYHSHPMLGKRLKALSD